MMRTPAWGEWILTGQPHLTLMSTDSTSQRGGSSLAGRANSCPERQSSKATRCLKRPCTVIMLFRCLPLKRRGGVEGRPWIQMQAFPLKRSVSNSVGLHNIAYRCLA